MSRREILKEMQASTKKIEKRIKAYEYYKNYGKRLERAKKFTFYGEYIAPYIISLLLCELSLEKINHSALFLDEVKFYENVQETFFSNGKESLKRSNKETFEECFCVSTAWVQDEFGNYTREEVYYNLEALEKYDVSELLAMSSDELKNLFPVVNRKKYTKNSLDEEDLIYDENMVIISKNHREYNESLNITQTKISNILDIVICIIVTLIWGVGISKIVIRHRLSNKIGAFIEHAKYINLDEYQELLSIRQDNLSLLEENGKKLKKGAK